MSKIGFIKYNSFIEYVSNYLYTSIEDNELYNNLLLDCIEYLLS